MTAFDFIVIGTLSLMWIGIFAYMIKNYERIMLSNNFNLNRPIILSVCGLGFIAYRLWG